MSYRETIDYLFNLQKHGIKFGLSNTRALMERMGNPHQAFPSIHVAGTNGKGSVSAFLAAMLQRAGLRVGLYTSPHLISFTERIRINQELISELDVVALAGRVRKCAEGASGDRREARFIPTFFEVTTAMAFAYFADHKIDIAVVETGMGGRLDATNVLTPLVSVITNIDLEHTEFLGDTLEAIAREKAGIIKPGVPVVTAVTQPEVIAVMEAAAAANGAELFRRGNHFSDERVPSAAPAQFTYHGISTTYRDLRIAMLGAYQVDNACLALAAAECLAAAGFGVDEAAVREGLAQTRWEGRLEKVADRPDVFLDGAHNPASARMLAGALAELKSAYRRLILVIGILADKDSRGILTALAPCVDHAIVTKPLYSRAKDTARLAAEARSLLPSVETAETLDQAVAAARKAAEADDLIVITGSLFTVGDARALFFQPAAQASAALRELKG